MMGQSMHKFISDTAGGSTTIAVYQQAKIDRIRIIADRLASNKVNENIKLVDTPVVAEVPVSDTWDFKLGDRVRIRYSLSEFKSIQLQTVGWKTHLSKIHSCESVVIRRLSSFQNVITIYTPSTDSISEVYAGVLEKISNYEIDDESSSAMLQFKVNDYVQFNGEKIDCKNSYIIRSRYHKRRGRITALAKSHLYVTFNEKTSKRISSAILDKSEDTSELEIPERFHCQGLRIGQSVELPYRSISNQNLIVTKWKEVKIIHISRNGDFLRVQHDIGKDFLIEIEEVERDGTQVRIRVYPLCLPGNIVTIRSLPTSLENIFLFTQTAVIESAVDGNYVRVRFGCDIHLEVPIHDLRLADAEELKCHYEIQSMTENIKPGSAVIPDLGPSEFLSKHSLSLKVADDVRTILTKPSVFVGFISQG